MSKKARWYTHTDLRFIRVDKATDRIGLGTRSSMQTQTHIGKLELAIRIGLEGPCSRTISISTWSVGIYTPDSNSHSRWDIPIRIMKNGRSKRSFKRKLQKTLDKEGYLDERDRDKSSHGVAAAERWSQVHPWSEDRRLVQAFELCFPFPHYPCSVVITKGMLNNVRCSRSARRPWSCGLKVHGIGDQL